jgi:xanthine/CO dehydrogenase XdhC/CoxF family maturation factor
MKLLFGVIALGLGGCASSKSPTLAVPSPTAPRVAVNPAGPKRPTPLTQALAAQSAPVWLVLPGDRTVANMLARWAKDAGWTVNWNDAPEILITGNGKVDKPDFLSAADFVISDAKAKGYALQARAYGDHVLDVKKVGE